MEDKKFSRREWFFVILVVVLIQFMVQYAAFIYAGNKSALGYVSISGTIVSIILALLAIIYSYFQSASQHSASSSLNSQIDKLIAIVDQVKNSKSDFSEEITSLTEIREKIDSSINIQRQSHNKVNELSNTVDILLENNLTSYTQDKDDLGDFNNLVTKGNNIIHIALLVIYQSIEKGISFKNIWGTLGENVVVATHEEGVTKDQKEYYHGAIVNVIYLLSSLGYIDIPDESLVVVPTADFESNLEQFYLFIESRDDGYFKDIVSVFESVEV